MSSHIGRLLVAASVTMAFALIALSPVEAASPSASARPAAGDPRSSGEGPGLIGDPVAALAVVLGIGLASLVLTYAYVRLTAGRTRP